MDISAPLSVILNNGLLGALLVLALLVISWQQRRYDKLLEKYDDKSEHMYQQVIGFKDNYHNAMNTQTETQRVMAEKISAMAQSVGTIANGVERLIYRSEQR